MNRSNMFGSMRTAMFAWWLAPCVEIDPFSIVHQVTAHASVVRW
ncbi:hypothetical protein Salmuc_01746 [Salipiger mucosus DSM 16094]|uniref:Uncharacterized protein n=1 Tax=Salipiger mucosus DSM 16094 TaxID=1123237 RepID=S9QRE6_9RHOB|nr:hypothetical protein Salmuc_01746 [Salipiger mucosus DSM 16094]